MGGYCRGGRPGRGSRVCPDRAQPDDYVELLRQWRAVNAYSIRLNWRTYDREDGGLDQLRRAPSGVRERRNLWEIRHDPYDVSHIHVRGPGGWITAFWKHLNRAPMPSVS